MAESLYKIITLVGTNTESWEKAAAAVDQASKSLRDLRIAEVGGERKQEKFEWTFRSKVQGNCFSSYV